MGNKSATLVILRTDDCGDLRRVHGPADGVWEKGEARVFYAAQGIVD